MMESILALLDGCDQKIAALSALGAFVLASFALTVSNENSGCPLIFFLYYSITPFQHVTNSDVLPFSSHVRQVALFIGLSCALART